MKDVFLGHTLENFLNNTKEFFSNGSVALMLRDPLGCHVIGARCYGLHSKNMQNVPHGS